METIKYCSKNDKLGTKKVYQDIGVHFPEIEQQRKGCLSECKTCRRQPFAKIGKKQLVCSDSPEQLYKQLTAMINQSAADSATQKKQKPEKSIDSAKLHYGFNPRSKNELTISLDTVSAAKLSKKLSALQRAGEPRKMKAIRFKKSASLEARVVLAIAKDDSNQLEVKKNTLILHLTAHTLQELQVLLATYIEEGKLPVVDPFIFMRTKSDQKVQMHLTQSESIQHAVTG
ncbi:DUF1450 domain-containing protein [Paenibacillus bovis]|uniref:Uncharacterized protein n=1 Tax=Paenibacillus bovis TaxID=1616788 RepID=A0A172ZJ09_9BACL|nr:DUF1450 domain-containing protein [Paenibacillus bovis]ANF97382.1 hypothetical protein AR543_16145 [Paenibacillus bovis]